MAWSASYVASQFVRDTFKAVITPDFDTDTFKVALFNNSVTPSPNTDPQRYNLSPWDANEVYGTGWAQGGVALSTPAFTLVTDVGVMFDAVDVSESSTTLTNAYGCIVYDDTLSSPAADYVVVAVYFGGSAYSTNNGTFGITWDTNGIFRIDLTP